MLPATVLTKGCIKLRSSASSGKAASARSARRAREPARKTPSVSSTHTRRANSRSLGKAGGHSNGCMRLWACAIWSAIPTADEMAIGTPWRLMKRPCW